MRRTLLMRDIQAQTCRPKLIKADSNRRFLLVTLLRAAAPLILSVGLSVGLSACGPRQPASVNLQPVNGASLRAARQRWAAARIEVYDYRPNCALWSRGEWQALPQPRVSVRHGQVTAPSGQSAGQSAGQPAGPPGFLEQAGPLTIEAIFGLLEHSAVEQSLTALFDADTGVPLVVCAARPPENNSGGYCAVGSLHVPQRHSGFPERLRWAQAPLTGLDGFNGACPRTAAGASGPDAPG